MIFSFLVFEYYFPFAIKAKNKNKVEPAMDEVSDNNNDMEFVELSILMQKELQINIKNQNHNNFQKVIKKEEKEKKGQENLKSYEKYFFFLLKFLMKKDIKNSKSNSFKIEENVYNELKKAILTVDKENSTNSKNQIVIIRKNFEFEILDFYYDRQNILQYLIH